MIELKDTASYCCQAEIKRIGRCNYICTHCGKQQMLYLVFLYEAMEADDKIEKEKNESSTHHQTRRHRKLAA